MKIPVGNDFPPKCAVLNRCNATTHDVIGLWLLEAKMEIPILMISSGTLVETPSGEFIRNKIGTCAFALAITLVGLTAFAQDKPCDGNLLHFWGRCPVHEQKGEALCKLS